MPNTVTSTTLFPGNKPRWSRAAAAAMSTAGPTSIDVLTVLHGLKRSPTHVTVTPRSVVAAPSGILQPAVIGWNASTITIHLPAAGGIGAASAVQVDVVAEIMPTMAT